MFGYILMTTFGSTASTPWVSYTDCARASECEPPIWLPPTTPVRKGSRSSSRPAWARASAHAPRAIWAKPSVPAITLSSIH